MQAWWRANPVPFSASFTAFVDGLLREGRPDPAVKARWQGFVLGAPAAPATSPGSAADPRERS